MIRAARFVASLFRWLLGRAPLTSRPVIELRYSICEWCPARKRGWFRTYCDLCWCTISRRRWPFNKLAMSDQECPVKKWPKVAQGD